MADHWDTMADLFEQARKYPASKRSAFLDEACRGTPEMRAELEMLLANYKEAPAFFEDLGQAIPTPPRSANREATEADPYHLTGRLVSQYQVLDALGSGGMGVVYKALDINLERVMALKFLAPALSHNIEARRRFFAEARAVSALDHPNICTLYEVSETEDGLVFLAMKCYEGETLKEKVKRGALPIVEAVDYAAQIARGLARAHTRRIIHRDIKPSNIMVKALVPGEEGYGLVKILDFGLAKMADLELTRTGVKMGTTAYMSPEQLRGEAIDHRVDLWALGVILYEMLTGQRPFRGTPREITYLIPNQQPDPVTQLNPLVSTSLGHVVMKCLEKDNDDRYPSAQAILSDLRV